jgi:hypothetical protein
VILEWSSWIVAEGLLVAVTVLNYDPFTMHVWRQNQINYFAHDKKSYVSEELELIVARRKIIWPTWGSNPRPSRY